MSGDGHAGEVERAFTIQAEAFEDSERNQVLTTEARWVFDHLPVAADSVVLDVAAGTGHAARQLAATARVVVALDATAAMLTRGQASAAQEGLANVVFMRGDATALPFLDGSFDAVVSRFAAHHFEAPARVVAEMARCTRPGGHVALVDLTAAAHPGIAAEQNRLERLRDPSHTRMLSATELTALLTDAGLELTDVTTRALERPLKPWLDQAETPLKTAAELERALNAELELGEPATTGFQPRIAHGELWFTQTLTACVARRTA
jgi:ubiquinone/menaquinone biosynthesis C-methylase UbiE